MEILSLGEKIKRRRIYKGLTLKDICGDKFSVSKMSCIENGKNIPEEWILEHIGQVLEIEREYLKETIRDQIEKNILILSEAKNLDSFKSDIMHNLDVAQENGYYDLGVELIHTILRNRRYKKEHNITPELICRYREIAYKTQDNICKIKYTVDVANFYYEKQEYTSVLECCRLAREWSLEESNQSSEMLGESLKLEFLTYIKLQDFAKASEMASTLQEKNNEILANIVPEQLEVLNIIFNIVDLEKNADEVNLNKIDSDIEAINLEDRYYLKYIYAKTLFFIEYKTKAVDVIVTAVEEYPQNEVDKNARFVINCTELLVENECNQGLDNIIDKVVDLAVRSENQEYIERAYYYKAVTLLKKANILEAEMYMNLSIDMLEKFANTQQIAERYMEVGIMYQESGEISEGLRYLDWAFALKNKDIF